MEQRDEREKQTGTSACAKSAAKPAGDIALRWKWVERSIWTERMLVALETGVKGSRWYSLVDKANGANRKARSTNTGPMHSSTSWNSGGWLETSTQRTNHRHCRLESRMRENRLYGSEGGGAVTLSLPLSQTRRVRECPNVLWFDLVLPRPPHRMGDLPCN